MEVQLFRKYKYEDKEVFVLGKGVSDSGKIVIIYRDVNAGVNQYARVTVESTFAEGAKLI